MAKYAAKDITGERFGRLVAIRNTYETTKQGCYKWLCLCDCGNTTVVSIANLRKNGGTHSCGCVGAKARKKRHEEAEERKRTRKEEQQKGASDKRHDTFKRKFVEKYGNSFEYMGGYPEVVIVVKCKSCGFERYRNRRDIFTDENISCPECGNNRQGMKEASCEKCGAVFMQYSKHQTLCKTCHDEAVRIHDRAKRSINKRLRESRARENGKVDYSITLSKLIERDNHICQLCGREVSENDYIYVGDVFIAGNDYPSIDHIKPLSKGGVHQWNNVQLAHRLCNSLKNDKEI